MSGTDDEQQPGGSDRAGEIAELLALSMTERAAADVFDLLSRSHRSPASAARFRRQAAEARRTADRAERQARRLSGEIGDP